MTKDYTMTWVDCGLNGKKLFSRTTKNLTKELQEVYHIKDRQYEIKNIAEGDGVVMVECIGSYPNPKTKKVYRTPLVLVLEMRKGKIRTGRHYLDPRISGKHVTRTQIARAYANTRKSLVIIR